MSDSWGAVHIDLANPFTSAGQIISGSIMPTTAIEITNSSILDTISDIKSNNSWLFGNDYVNDSLSSSLYPSIDSGISSDFNTLFNDFAGDSSTSNSFKYLVADTLNFLNGGSGLGNIDTGVDSMFENYFGSGCMSSVSNSGINKPLYTNFSSSLTI